MKNEKVFVDNQTGYEVRVGAFCNQSNGAVWLKKGKTVVLATVNREESSEFPGFFPLSVDYREQFAAAGKIPGGYMKREGKPSEREVLQGRIIDRSIRPIFPTNFFDKIQLIVTVYSLDKDYMPTALALNAASLALSISDIPFLEPVSGCEVCNGKEKWIINPTHSELSQSESKLFVSGNIDGINMVECISSGINNNEATSAIFSAHETIKSNIDWQKKIIDQVKKEKIMSEDKFSINIWQEKAESFICNDKISSIFVNDKSERIESYSKILKQFVEENAQTEIPDSEKINESIVKYSFDVVLKKKLTNEMISRKSRVDGRNFGTVRDIETETSLLPANHGSAVFNRGQTQVLVSLTLGSANDKQRIDGIMEESDDPFMLHYNFLPLSVGEARPLRPPSRRDIGHGNLASNAIRGILPKENKFPYTIRLVADVLESDGSTSMATVCASTMSLLDAGVPVSDMVAGIAMGMIQSKDGKFYVLTDIAAFEDEFGLMDLKIAGTNEKITAIQMDIKYKGGLPRYVFETAFEQSKKARLSILEKMRNVMDKPKDSLSPLVPRIESLQVPKDKIGAIIGSGGKTIKEITEVTGTSINIGDSGTVEIFGTPGENLEKAINWVKALAKTIEIGTKLNGTIKKKLEFGYFVELFPNIDGLIHISTIDNGYSKEIKEGDKVNVVVVDYDPMTGRIRLKIVKQ
jgi:polyribonucleotide nucleotidyltransferase